jgi:hypothetical protein
MPRGEIVNPISLEPIRERHEREEPLLSVTR